MIHYMSLHERPFEMIKNGKKTIELRLNDEKRRNIKINDKIIFTNSNDKDKKILVKVINLFVFNSFFELYRSLPLNKCGYTNKELKTAKSEDMLVYYSQGLQDEFGVIGIEIRVL